MGLCADRYPQFLLLLSPHPLATDVCFETVAAAAAAGDSPQLHSLYGHICPTTNSARQRGRQRRQPTRWPTYWVNPLPCPDKQSGRISLQDWWNRDKCHLKRPFHQTNVPNHLEPYYKRNAAIAAYMPYFLFLLRSSSSFNDCKKVEVGHHDLPWIGSCELIFIQIWRNHKMLW